MHLHVFTARGDFYGFTEREDGGNLPATHGPWTHWRTLDAARETLPAPLTIEKLVESLWKNGMYATNHKLAWPAEPEPSL